MINQDLCTCVSFTLQFYRPHFHVHQEHVFLLNGRKRFSPDCRTSYPTIPKIGSVRKSPGIFGFHQKWVSKAVPACKFRLLYGLYANEGRAASANFCTSQEWPLYNRTIAQILNCTISNLQNCKVAHTSSMVPQ